MIPQTRTDLFLAKITGEDVVLPVPQTRFELYLANIAGESYELPAPNSRATLYLAKILGQNVVLPVPQTRSELYLASIAGMSVQLPEAPTTREEWYLARWAEDAGYVTITGNPVTFNAVAAKLKQLKIEFSPVQEGSGDPSPENERPIHGWSSLNVWQTGENLYIPSEMTEGAFVRAFNTSEVSPLGSVVTNAAWNASGYIKVKPNTKYTQVNPSYYAAAAAGLVFFADKTVESAISGVSVATQASETYTFTTPANCHYIRTSWYVNTPEGANPYPMIVEGNEAPAAFIPYEGQKIFVALGDTYYAGWADPTTGDGIATWAAVDMGSLDWSYTSPSAGLPYGYFDVTNIGYKPTGGLMCSCYKVVSSGWAVDKTIRNHGSIDKLYVIDGSYDNKNSFKQSVTGQYICYELAAPIPIQLTPQQINSLAGANTMWTDADTLTVEYRKDGNVSDAEALSMLLGGRYTPATGPDDVSDSEALSIITGR